MKALVCLLAFLRSLEAVNFSVLLNLSCFFHNYRHTSNVMAIRKILVDNGYTDEEVVLFCRDDVSQDNRNLLKGEISVGMESLRKGQDYVKGETGGYWDVLSMLRGKHRKLVEMDESSNLLLYITGHGGDGFMKFCNMEYLYRDDLTKAILEIQAVRGIGKVLVIVDTCQADTVIDYRKIEGKNIAVISTSKKGEESFSDEINWHLGVFPIDLFVRTLYQMKKDGKLDGESTLEDLCREFKPEQVKSTVSLRGNKGFRVKDFFFQNKERGTKTHFDL
jgi:GPI-anchor transamidase subunit K